MMYKIKDMPLSMDDIKCMIKKENSKKYIVLGVAVGVIATLIGVIIWVSKQRKDDLEEHYEYFDDESEDDFEDFDEGIYEEEPAQYVKIKDFINATEDEELNKEVNKEIAEEVTEEIKDELGEEIVEEIAEEEIEKETAPE